MSQAAKKNSVKKIPRNEITRALVRELQDHGITDFYFCQCRKHFKLHIRHNGKDHLTVVSCSASDWRGKQNALRDLRSTLGISRVAHKSTRPKRRKKKKDRPFHRSFNFGASDASRESTVKPDPWAVLKPLRDSLRREKSNCHI